MSTLNENREVAIKLSGVKKKYKLGQIGGGILAADLQSWRARVRGKDEPNTKIGQEERLVGQTFMALNGIDMTVYKSEDLGIIGGAEIDAKMEEIIEFSEVREFIDYILKDYQKI